ncbi:flavonol 3-sulfotransferase-like [Solanum stenotomum]|uniref:flavonol 3-sulfotransferase-like n=1 Tax=Solanum stenotomum TaxID=172797 RepID=UPI0020D03B59|nr:flavonol 3-sulfotransferase-like [Solanum stenotomum]
MRKKYKEMISTLPKRMPHHPLYDFYQYEDFWYYSSYLEAALCMQQSFNPQPSDIFLCSAPKTDLKEDTLGYVKKLAEFMDKPFSKEEQDLGVPQEIVARCDFESLSNLEVNKSGMHRPETTQEISNTVFFCKGEIGDWKNYLTEDMAKLIDDITHDKFQSSGLTFTSSACN